jgi:hypothetical protein
LCLSQLLDQHENTAAAQSLNCFHGDGLLRKRNIETPQMDDPTAEGLIRYESLEELSQIFRSVRTDTKMLSVRVLVRVATGDQNGPVSLYA